MGITGSTGSIGPTGATGSYLAAQDYGYFYLASSTFTTIPVGSGSNISWTQGVVSGGISLSGSQVQIVNSGASTGTYYVTFGYALGTGSPSNTSFGLVLTPPGTAPVPHLVLGCSVGNVLNSAAQIIQVAASTTVTLSAQNLSGVSKLLQIPGGSSPDGGVIAFLTIYRIE